MKRRLIVVALALAAGTASAQNWTVRPSLPNFGNNQFMRPGSYVNPYVIQDQNGNRVGQMRETYPAMGGQNPMMQPGSYLNPYVIEHQ